MTSAAKAPEVSEARGRRRQARERECFVCGCTEKRACPGGCAWTGVKVLLKDNKTPDPRRGFCTRCAFVIRRALAEQKRLKIVKPVDRAIFSAGVRAALRITRDWRP